MPKLRARAKTHPKFLLQQIFERLAAGEFQKDIFDDMASNNIISCSYVTFRRALAKGREQNRVRDMLENRNRTMPQIAPQHQFAVSNKSEDEFDIEKMWNGQ